MNKNQLFKSEQVAAVLARYPQWYQMVSEAVNQPFLDAMYSPNVIEIFDQYGLLAGRVHNSASYECPRNEQDKSEFIAWLFDGELALFYVDVGNKAWHDSALVVVNRLQLLAELCEG